ncbi:trace amine-associated receptor 4-like [Protopterus annectens]|uniref:trace amine-associated receptor 4-like n=1 Tax=Protopterus annectens TaxID=7888 RepID=UPI001CFC378E|nr:trace amine-associated receptor 4-like [Protopterus annectens]XP_043913045.1 trace amine-associated receptor 4-like [Protopterus annectens]
MTEYCYPALNNSCIKSPSSFAVHAALYTCVIGFIAITIFGNLLVIISVTHFKQLHHPTNILICSLAVVDFLVGFTVMPYSMIRTIESCWYFGDSFCKIHTSFDMMFCISSVFHLCFIATDRHYAVCDPLHYYTKITFSTVIVFIIISWTVPLMFTFGTVLSGVTLDGISNYAASVSCIGLCMLLFNKLWSLLVPFISFIFPATVMVCLYSKIFVVARRHAIAIDNKNEGSEKSKTLFSSKSERKAAKTLGIVMGTFVMCWLPLISTTIFDAFLNHATPAVLYDAFMWFAYSNSGFNPIIYSFFYPWFRQAVYIILSGKVFSSNSSRIRLFLENH